MKENENARFAGIDLILVKQDPKGVNASYEETPTKSIAIMLDLPLLIDLLPYF